MKKLRGLSLLAALFAFFFSSARADTLTVRAGFGKMAAYVSKIEYEHPEVPQALADAIVG